MARRIVWSRTAHQDLRSLIKYISKDSPARAEQFGYKIVSNIELLQHHPHLGRVVPELNQTNLREVIVKPYRIIYRFQEQAQLIEIIRVWHSARNTPEIE